MLFRCVALLFFITLVIEDIKEAPEQRMKCGGEPDIGATLRLTPIPGWHNAFRNEKARSIMEQFNAISEIHLGVRTSEIDAVGSP